MTEIDAANRLSILRVRHNNMWDPFGSPLHESLKQLHGHTYSEAEFRFHNRPEELLLFMKSAISRNPAPITFVATEYCDLLPEALVEAMNFLEQEKADIVITATTFRNPADTLAAPVEVTPELLSGGYEYYRSKLLLDTYPFQLLTTCLFRTTELAKLVDELLALAPRSHQELSEMFWSRIFSGPPCRSAFWPSSFSNPSILLQPEENLRFALKELDNSKAASALKWLEEVEGQGCAPADYGYLRGFALAKLGRTMEARESVRCFLKTATNHKAARELFDLLDSALPAPKSISYSDIRVAVEQVPGYMLKDQEEFLFNKAKSVPEGGNILEIGCWIGRSTAAMGYGALGRGVRISCIDTFSGNDGLMGRSDDHESIFRGNMRRNQMEHQITILRGYSHQILEHWDPQVKIDFAFIDGSHEYKDVKRDFELIYPHLRDGGFVAFHDVEPGWPGSWRVWREIAMPLLDSHQRCATLTSGRKRPGVDWPTFPKPFSYVAEYIAEIRSERPYLVQVAGLLERASSRDSSMDPAIGQIEMIISGLPNELHAEFKFMCDKEPDVDGLLHFWVGLGQLKRGLLESAQQYFQRAMTQPFPADRSRVERYIVIPSQQLVSS